MPVTVEVPRMMALMSLSVTFKPTEETAPVKLFKLSNVILEPVAVTVVVPPITSAPPSVTAPPAVTLKLPVNVRA